ARLRFFRDAALLKFGPQRLGDVDDDKEMPDQVEQRNQHQPDHARGHGPVFRRTPIQRLLKRQKVENNGHQKNGESDEHSHKQSRHSCAVGKSMTLVHDESFLFWFELLGSLSCVLPGIRSGGFTRLDIRPLPHRQQDKTGKFVRRPVRESVRTVSMRVISHSPSVCWKVNFISCTMESRSPAMFTSTVRSATADCLSGVTVMLISGN